VVLFEDEPDVATVRATTAATESPNLLQGGAGRALALERPPHGGVLQTHGDPAPPPTIADGEVLVLVQLGREVDLEPFVPPLDFLE
jgi:hypothetical protein